MVKSWYPLEKLDRNMKYTISAEDTVGPDVPDLNQLFEAAKKLLAVETNKIFDRFAAALVELEETDDRS